MPNHIYKFNAEMKCNNCTEAMKNGMEKMKGVIDVNPSLEKKTVDVTTESSVTYEQVLEKAKKINKKVSPIKDDGKPEQMDE